MAKTPKPVATLGDLTPDPQNARKHNPRNIGQVQASLQKYGAARSIVIDENNQIIAGHGVVEAAALAGIERVQVVDGDGETIIAVRRSGLSKQQKQELGIADNRGAELAEWDADVLTALAGEIDLSQFWKPEELVEVLNQVPNFEPVGIDEQGRLDQKKPVTCPECGHEFVPKA
jgi:ParB family chromosome partitioning protein